MEGEIRDKEAQLILELSRNSRRSDRALARSLKVSQTTISRTVRRLEKEGLIKGYTLVPDFAKLGYEILAFTFGRIRGTVAPDEVNEVRSLICEHSKGSDHDIVTVSKGIGLNSDVLIISLHTNFASFSIFADSLRQYNFFEKIRDSFLVNLSSESQHIYFAMSKLARKVSSNAPEKTNLVGPCVSDYNLLPT